MPQKTKPTITNEEQQPEGTAEMIENAYSVLPESNGTFADSQAIFSAFHEAIVVIGRDRGVISAFGALDEFFSGALLNLTGIIWEYLLPACANPENRDSLYWAVEASIEGHVASHFLPFRIPLRDDSAVH